MLKFWYDRFLIRAVERKGQQINSLQLEGGLEGTVEPESQQNGGKINTPLQLEHGYCWDTPEGVAFSQNSKHHFGMYIYI